MAARDLGATSSGDSGRYHSRLTDYQGRETWLCRSTVGAGSDIGDDAWSEVGDDAIADDVAAAASETSEDVDSISGAVAHKPSHKPRPRKLTLGNHMDVARAHALRKIIPPLPVTPLGVEAASATPHAKKSRYHSLFDASTGLGDSERTTTKKKKEHEDADAHLMIYMDFHRDEGFATRPPRREVYMVRQVWTVHVALFISTACVHCVSFNVSPALRKLFKIEALPVGLCIVVAWTILGLVNCLGACLGSRSDRISLLRRLAWLWVFAIMILQLTKLLPLPPRMANSFLGIGYTMAVAAHGLLVPNAVALGAELVATKALTALGRNDPDLRQQQTVDVALGAYFTWTFAAMMLAASLVQVIYFATVSLELPSGEDVLILRNRRTVYITVPCGAMLLAIIVAFLFQSRHHCEPRAQVKTLPSCDRSPFQDRSGESESMKSVCSLERKLARGELDSHSLSASVGAATSTDVGFRAWWRLARRSFALVALGFFALMALLAASATLVALAIPSGSTTSSTLVHLGVFATLAFGWLMTMLLSASQLAPAPRNKLYGRLDDVVVHTLPSRRQLFVLVTLLCLACAAALAAFLRAQLYSTLFVQTCQLRRPHDASAAFDPNVLAALVGLVSVAVLPAVQFLLRRKTISNPDVSPRVSAVQRVAIGVLLYLLAIFLSSIVELYRRDARRSPHEAFQNPSATGCNKVQPSNFSVWWSAPHLLVLSLADAVFRVGAAEEAHFLAFPLNWQGVAQAVLSLADSVGYASALALSRTLSSWLYQVQTSDLVLLLLIVTAITSLSYALTKRLAEHAHASRRQPSPQDHAESSDDEVTNEMLVVADEKSVVVPVNTSTSDTDCDRKEALLLAREQLTPRLRLTAVQR